MGTVTLVGVGNTTYGTTSVTPASVAGVADGDQPFMLVCSKRPGDTQPAAPTGWTRDFSEIGNPDGTVTPSEGPFYLQVHSRDTVVSGGSITWPSVSNPGGSQQVIGATAVVARPAVGESLTWATAWGQDLDGGTSYSVTAGTALDLAPGDLVVAFTVITDNGASSSGGTISAVGVTFGATTERQDTASGNGDDIGCYVHTASVTAGTATVAPTITQTLSSSHPDFNRGATVFLRIRSLSPTVEKSGSDTSGTGSESLTSLAVAVSGSDSGTGSEQGFVADMKSGSDSGAGSEDGYVAQPSSGEDSGTGSEDGSVSATTSGSDSGTGTESVALDVATEGFDDTGAGSEQGYITLPGSDTATGAAALAALAATTSGADSATGSEGGYVEERFGDVVGALIAIHPVTGESVALPDAHVDISRERNGAGSIRVEYPIWGENFSILRDTITSDRDLEVEIWVLGTKTGAYRGFLEEASGDDVAETGMWTFAGRFAEKLMSEAVAWPRPIITTTTVTTTEQISEDPPQYRVTKKTTVGSSAGGPPVTTTQVTIEESGYEGETVDTHSTTGELDFADVTPGELMVTLVDEAQDRGALDGMILGFSDTQDSGGTPWPTTVTSKFSPGTTYEAILSRLVELGVAEWGVTWTGSAYRLDLWVIGGRGVDRTVGLRPIVLRWGRNLQDAPRRWSVRESGTALLAAGSEGVYEDTESATAEARRGRRIELFASANNLEDHQSVQGFAQNALQISEHGALEITHGIAFLPGEPRPGAAFDIGDWVYSEQRGGLERIRVVQWTLSWSPEGASGTVTLNDTFSDSVSRLKARLDALVSGDTVVGTSEGSAGGQDTSVPLPPEVTDAGSVAYLDGTLGVRAMVSVALQMPVVNVDGTVITDLDQVIVEFALASSPDVWNAGITKKAPTSTAQFTAPAGQSIHIRACVLDRHGNRSVWSHPPYPLTTADDDIPPPVPSAPTVTEFLGTLRIAWDGQSEDAVDMPEAALDFDHVEVHVSPSSLFEPDETTLVGRMYGAGTFSVVDLPYGVEQFVRLVAVDWSGNKSDPSEQDSATPAQVVSADIFDGAVGTAKLADAAIVTAKIADLAVNDAKIGSLSVGKLVSGNLTADVILSTGGIKTATSGTRVELDSAGLRLYNSSNIMVDLKTSNGSALVVGEFRTALSGQRIVFNPGGALPDTMYFYPNGAGDFARIMSRTAPLDGSAAILIDGGAANGQPRGRLGAYRFESFLSFVTNDAGGDTSAGYSLSAVSVTQNLVNTWYQGAAHFTRYNNQNPIAGTRVIISSVLRGGSQRSTVIGDQQDCGIRFDDGAANIVKGNGTTFAPLLAADFVQSSSREVKVDESPIYRAPDEVVRAVESKQWRYTTVADPSRGAPGSGDELRFGPMAEDLQQVLPELVREVSGQSTVSISGLVGVLWEALRRALIRIEALESSAQQRDDTDE